MSAKKFAKNLPFEVDKLITKNGEASVRILDAELDFIDCTFNNDETVTINTKDYEYINLTLDNLKSLKKFILQAEKYYDEFFAEEENNDK